MKKEEIKFILGLWETIGLNKKSLADLIKNNKGNKIKDRSYYVLYSSYCTEVFEIVILFLKLILFKAEGVDDYVREAINDSRLSSKDVVSLAFRSSFISKEDSVILTNFRNARNVITHKEFDARKWERFVVKINKDINTYFKCFTIVVKSNYDAQKEVAVMNVFNNPSQSKNKNK